MLCTCVENAITCYIYHWGTKYTYTPYAYTISSASTTRIVHAHIMTLCEMHCQMHLANSKAVQAAFLDEAVVPISRLVG